MGCRAGLILLVVIAGILSAHPAQAEVPQKVNGGAGFRTFDGKKYYYDSSGKLVKNQIVHSNGHYRYVEADGQLNKDAVIQMAVNFVVKNARKHGTRKDKLRDCYRKLISYRYSRYYKGRSMKVSEKNNRLLAASMFKHKNGYCYKYATAMTYCATVLGFKTRMVSGALCQSNYVHGWCEVQIGDEWRVLDCSRQRHHSRNLFLIEKPPYRLIRFSNFYLKTENGKAFWKQGGK